MPFPPNKGEKLRTYYQLKRLRELGHQLSVFSFAETSEDRKNAEALARDLDIDVEVVDLGPKLWRYSRAILTGKPISVGAFYTPEMIRKLDRFLRSAKVDLLFLTASSLVTYVQILFPTRNWPCKVMIDFMDVDSDKWRQYADSSRWPMKAIYQRESKGIRLLEQYASQYFDSCFLIAQEEVKLFAEKVSDQKSVSVLGNGMAFDTFYPPDVSPDINCPQFLFTGVMDYKPNIDAVLWFYKHCWPQIIKAMPKASFIIAGMNPTSDILSLRDDPSIHVTGFVDDILPYFHRASVFVAPFRIARGVQNKVLQGAACKIPLVVTPMGAEGIAFASEKTMYLASTPEEFIDSCISAVKDRELAESKAASALEALLHTYGWQEQLRPMEEALNSYA